MKITRRQLTRLINSVLQESLNDIQSCDNKIMKPSFKKQADFSYSYKSPYFNGVVEFEEYTIEEVGQIKDKIDSAIENTFKEFQSYFCSWRVQRNLRNNPKFVTQIDKFMKLPLKLRFIKNFPRIGEYDDEKNEVRMDGELKISELTTTLFHEILHGMAEFVPGILTKWKKSKEVSKIGVEQYAKNNPEIVKKINKKLRNQFPYNLVSDSTLSMLGQTPPTADTWEDVKPVWDKDALASMICSNINVRDYKKAKKIFNQKIGFDTIPEPHKTRLLDPENKNADAVTKYMCRTDEGNVHLDMLIRFLYKEADYQFGKLTINPDAYGMHTIKEYYRDIFRNILNFNISGDRYVKNVELLRSMFALYATNKQVETKRIDALLEYFDFVHNKVQQEIKSQMA